MGEGRVECYGITDPPGVAISDELKPYILELLRLQRKEQKYQWISVEDKNRQPEEDKDVLVWYEYFRYGDYNRMYQTYGIGCKNREYWSVHEGGVKARCLAWMPLPEPPKGREIESDMEDEQMEEKLMEEMGQYANQYYYEESRKLNEIEFKMELQEPPKESEGME